MLPIQRKISSYNHYKGNNIRYIVLHYVGAKGTAKNNVDYFYNGDRQASAHYFVDDISIWQSVEDYNGSWAVGNTRTEVNYKNSINIEMCCPNPQLLISEKTESNTVELVKYLMDKYNIPIRNVRTHYEVSGKTKVCPNWNMNNWSRWNSFKEKLSSNSSNTNNNVNINKEERCKMKYAICYTNDVDERAAKYLRDYLGEQAQIFDARIKMNWKGFAENLIAVGGDSTPMGFSGYTTHRIKGDTRYTTAQKVLDICLGKGKLDNYKVK